MVLLFNRVHVTTTNKHVGACLRGPGGYGLAIERATKAADGLPFQVVGLSADRLKPLPQEIADSKAARQKDQGDTWWEWVAC